MPRKEYRKEHFKCPLCEKEGWAEYEENSDTCHSRGQLDTKIENISIGFHYHKNDKGDFEIQCDKCNAPIYLIISTSN
jgi:RecJ-like exonuclease